MLKQNLLKQTSIRIPEPNQVMADKINAEEYTKAAMKSRLNVVYDLIGNLILELAPKEGKALDIACGSGELLTRYAPNLPNIDFVAVDYSDEMLNILKQNVEKNRITNIQTKKEDMFKLDFKENTYDMIIWNLALHHCNSDEEVIVVLNEIEKILKANGTLFILDINRLKNDKLINWFVEHSAKGTNNYFYQDTYNSYHAAYAYQELSQILKKSNLTNYKHIKPFGAGFIQIIYRTSDKNKQESKISNLKTFSEKIDYTLLKLGLLGRI